MATKLLCDMQRWHIIGWLDGQAAAQDEQAYGLAPALRDLAAQLRDAAGRKSND